MFFGTPAAAVPTLHRLLASPHPVLAAVTAPDRPKGRGMALAASPVKEAARAAGIPVRQPRTLRDPEEQAALAALGADVFVVCAYGLILPPAVLEAPPLGAVNVHFSLLPAYRGAAPVAAAILDGRDVSGVTIMQMDPGLDTGPVLAQAIEPIRPDDDTGTLEGRLAVLGADLLVSALGALSEGHMAARPQDEAGATYAAKVTPEGARIDWRADPAAIAAQVRAFSPRPGAWTAMNGRRLKVWRASVAGGRSPFGPSASPPGTVSTGAGGAMLVAAGEGEAAGAVALDEVQPEGGRRMPGAALLRGLREPPVLV